MYELLNWSGPVTHRQFMVECYWRDMQWDRPSRTDCYIMQASCQVRNVSMMFSKKAKPSSMKDMVLDFGRAKKRGRASSQEMSAEEAAMRSKAAWLGGFLRAGVKIKGLESGVEGLDAPEEKVEMPQVAMPVVAGVVDLNAKPVPLVRSN